jgi:hypothetical protein
MLNNMPVENLPSMKLTSAYGKGLSMNGVKGTTLSIFGFLGRLRLGARRAPCSFDGYGKSGKRFSPKSYQVALFAETLDDSLDPQQAHRVFVEWLATRVSGDQLEALAHQQLHAAWDKQRSEPWFCT